MRVSTAGRVSTKLTRTQQLPDTNVGAAKRLSTGGKRFWCTQCADMRRVVKVTGIEQFESKASYQVILDCPQAHERVIEQSVERTQAGLDVLSEQKQTAARFRAEHELLDEVDIRSEMESEQLL